MTEFETATLAFQTGSLALRESALWIAVAQVAVVWYGIRAMQRASEQDQRHTEAMRALETLIERTAP